MKLLEAQWGPSFQLQKALILGSIIPVMWSLVPETILRTPELCQGWEVCTQCRRTEVTAGWPLFFCCFETKSGYVDQAGLKFMIFSLCLLSTTATDIHHGVFEQHWPECSPLHQMKTLKFPSLSFLLFSFPSLLSTSAPPVQHITDIQTDIEYGNIRYIEPQIHPIISITLIMIETKQISK